MITLEAHLFVLEVRDIATTLHRRIGVKGASPHTCCAWFRRLANCERHFHRYLFAHGGSVPPWTVDARRVRDIYTRGYRRNFTISTFIRVVDWTRQFAISPPWHDSPFPRRENIRQIFIYVSNNFKSGLRRVGRGATSIANHKREIRKPHDVLKRIAVIIRLPFTRREAFHSAPDSFIREISKVDSARAAARSRGHFHSKRVKARRGNSTVTFAKNSIHRGVPKENREKWERRSLYNVTISIHDCEVVVVLGAARLRLICSVICDGSWRAVTNDSFPLPRAVPLARMFSYESPPA